MGIDPRSSGLQHEPSGAMVASPGFGRVEQRLSYSAGPAVWCYGKILDPGSLPEPYRDDVEIDGRKPDECLVVVRDEDGRTIVRDGRSTRSAAVAGDQSGGRTPGGARSQSYAATIAGASAELACRIMARWPVMCRSFDQLRASAD